MGEEADDPACDQVQDITELLAAWTDGNDAALDQLVPLVYAGLKGLARRHMFRESEDHLMQSTALVHEAYRRMVAAKPAKWQNRVHFFAVSRMKMRRILVDAAPTRRRQKRGGDASLVPLDEAPALSVARASEFVALGDGLNELPRLKERRSRVVEMRYFGGMSLQETAAVGTSVETVNRDWRTAKAWLHAELIRACSMPSLGDPVE